MHVFFCTIVTALRNCGPVSRLINLWSNIPSLNNECFLRAIRVHVIIFNINFITFFNKSTMIKHLQNNNDFFPRTCWKGFYLTAAVIHFLVQYYRRNKCIAEYLIIHWCSHGYLAHNLILIWYFFKGWEKIELLIKICHLSNFQLII